jgi:AraC-like DNA-binding protein
MSTTLYEFKGRNFTSDQGEVLSSSMRRDFYSADCAVFPESQDLYFCNSRSFAGYIPISKHRTIGLRTVTRRTLQGIRSDSSDIFLILFPVHGRLAVTQSCRTVTVEPGQFVLVYANEPLCVSTTPNAEREHLSYQVTAPAHLVGQALAEPKRLCAMPFPSGQGAAKLACDLFLSLFEEADHLDRHSAEALALSALNVIFRTVEELGADAARSIGVREQKLQRLMDYLELHYSDPELTTQRVATACGISTRYLHYLLKSRGTRFYDYLWQARLNSARQQLTNPALVHRTISEISYSIGFKSSAHFSRAFRNHFDRSPREVRQEALAKGIVAVSAVPALWLSESPEQPMGGALMFNEEMRRPALVN